MNTNKITVKVLAEIAIFSALALALDFLQSGYSKGLFINGGSIGIAMVPIFIIAYRRGLLAGLICGFIVSVLQMLGGILICPVADYSGVMRVLVPFFQVSLDYVLAYTFVGFAGAFAGLYKGSKSKGKKLLWIIVGCLVGGLLKYLVHVLSGGFFYLNFGGEFFGVKDDSWFYSFFYNGCFSIPSIVLSTAIMAIIGVFYPQILLPGNKGDGEVVEVKDDDDQNYKEIPNNENGGIE